MATSVMLYGDIGMDFWSGDGITEEHVVCSLRELDPNAKQHEVHINSVGGRVDVGLAIMNILRSHAAQMKAANPDFQLVTYNDGYAMSIASVILMAGDRRVAALGSVGMIHDAWTGVYGNAADMRKQAETLDVLSQNIADIYANRCVPAPEGSAVRDAAYFRALMEKETYMVGDSMVKNGLCTELDTALTAEMDKSLTPENMQGKYVHLMTAGYKKRTFTRPTAAASLLNAKVAKQRLDSFLATVKP